ncbi:MAG: alcohol dehydrogenase [Gemmatales bacterium]|nr:MAG: alcohol dehydrogenase [Gemmatales bacterium]
MCRSRNLVEMKCVYGCLPARSIHRICCLLGGRYASAAQLPATPGFEGMGVVDAVGPGWLAKIRRLKPGRRVAVLNRKSGNWQEYVVIPARQAVPVPDDLSDEQAAAFFVNPASALAMIRHVLRVQKNSWLAQTAAGSALGRMVIRLGRHFGFKTINVIRRPEQAQELLDLGGNEVICTAKESVTDRLQAITGGTGVPYALDAVGGETGSQVAAGLAVGGRMLVYGTLSDQPLSVHPRLLISGQRIIEGFWLSIWAQNQRVITMLSLFRQIMRLLQLGVLTSEIAATYPLDRIKDAVEHAARPGKNGKVLLRIGD